MGTGVVINENEKLLPGQKWEGHVPLLREPQPVVTSGDVYPDTSRTLTWAKMREAIALADNIGRPWRHLIGKCEFLPPSTWLPDGQLYVLDLSGTGLGNGYRVVGTEGDYVELRVRLNDLGIPEQDHAAAVVFWQLQKSEAKQASKQRGGVSS